MKKTRKIIGIAAVAVAALFVVALVVNLALRAQMEKERTQNYTHNTFVMSTLVTQSAYGKNANQAMQDVAYALVRFEQQLSLFDSSSDIARVNAAAGSGEGVEVSRYTADLIWKALTLSLESKNSFAISIAPLTLAWGITTDSPHVVPQDEIEELLPLVDDTQVAVWWESEHEDTAYAMLQQADMGIDLGGIAKGDACTLAKSIYDSYGVESAYISIGGNVYARGVKPNGDAWRIGFRTPEPDTESYIASFEMTDLVIAVSGGYERFFEEDGETYIHILDPRTGAPVKSDIASIGVIHSDGGIADFYSTSLFVLGMDAALGYMQNGITCILLDGDNNLYVSASLKDSFELFANGYSLQFVEGS